MPHRGQQLADHDPAAGRRLALVEALLHRVHDLVEREAAGEVLLGGVAHLGVDDAVGGQVLDALAGDPGELLGGLHHRDGVVEGLQVALQRAGVRGLGEPLPERLGVVGAGSSCPISRASSTMVSGRSPPSRWSCSSTFGALRTRSGSSGDRFGACRQAHAPSCPTEEVAMRVFSTFEEIESAAGEEIGTTEWLEITQERVDQFADATGDHQWIHVDRGASAKEGRSAARSRTAT